MASRVRMNIDACDAVISVLQGHQIPPDREDSALPHIEPELVPNFYFYLVGICHQTSPRNRVPVEGFVNGQYRRGWDFLYARLEHASADDPTLLSVDRWTRESIESFSHIFSDVKHGVRLVGIRRRVELVRDMGVVLLRQGLESISGIYERCNGHLLGPEPSLLTELATFQAYRDPVQKKSLFFLSIMRNSGMWSYPDDDHLEAPVDYHEVRGHLRLGTVHVTDDQLRFRIRHGLAVAEEDDIALRMTTRNAIRYIADRLSVSPSRAHYLFWNVFRCICTREDPQCLEVANDNPLPRRYKHLTETIGPNRTCPFAHYCPSAHSHDRLIDHVCDTDYY